MNEQQEQVEVLRSKLSSAEASFAAATKGYKKMRQMRGADAHKRAWHFEEQMQKWSNVVDRVRAELERVETTGENSA